MPINDHAKWHLTYGIARRVFILLKNYEIIAYIVPENRTEPITLEEQTDLDIHLNSLFFHIAGLLDNLAWAIHYHLRIPSGVDERRKIGLTKIGLFNKEFRLALAKASPELEQLLQSYSEWHAVIKNLRDPIAHRIPIYAVPALLNDEESMQYQLKFGEYVSGIGKRNEEESDRLLEELQYIGTYKPVFDLSDGHSGTLFPIRGRIDIDLSNAMTIASSGIDLFRSTKSEEP